MSASGESTLSTFVASDGDHIVIQDWPLESHAELRGVVILVHGLGEHAGRYAHVAEQLNRWGFAVRGYDQCGHGESGGPRGSLPTDTRLLDDLADIVDSTRARMPKNKPLIVLGHSMGGLVAARFVSLALRPIDGLVLSSPALDPGLNIVQKLLLAVLPKVVPNLRVGNGIKPQYISHDIRAMPVAWCPRAFASCARFWTVWKTARPVACYPPVSIAKYPKTAWRRRRPRPLFWVTKFTNASPGRTTIVMVLPPSRCPPPPTRCRLC